MKTETSDLRVPSDRNTYARYWRDLVLNPTIVSASLALILVHFVFFLLYTNHLDFFRELTREDGPLENLQALMYFTAGIIFLLTSKKAESTKGKYWMWLFAIGFMLIAGEEISWGQRIFGFSLESVEMHSTQDEFNIHNLEVLSPLSPSRILTLMSLSLGVLAPIALLFRPLYIFASDTLKFPLPHPVIGVCFIASYVWYVLYHPDSPYPVAIEESRETTIALGFLIYAVMSSFATARQS